MCRSWESDDFIFHLSVFVLFSVEDTKVSVEIEESAVPISAVARHTAELLGLHMFDQPSSPEKWERVWSEVEAA